MPVSLDEMLNLLRSDELQRVESAIASSAGTHICSDHLQATAQFTLQEVNLAGLTAESIRIGLERAFTKIVQFGVTFLRDEASSRIEQEYPPGEEPDDEHCDEIVSDEGLAVGFGILYFIYLHYLENCSESDLCAFLNARRIPHHKRFARDLRRIYDGLENQGESDANA